MLLWATFYVIVAVTLCVQSTCGHGARRCRDYY